jgi:hypothetical protein
VYLSLSPLQHCYRHDRLSCSIWVFVVKDYFKQFRVILFIVVPRMASANLRSWYKEMMIRYVWSISIYFPCVLFDTYYRQMFQMYFVEFWWDLYLIYKYFLWWVELQESNIFYFIFMRGGVILDMRTRTKQTCPVAYGAGADIWSRNKKLNRNPFSTLGD